MPNRDTGTGSVLEQMILPSLRRGGYTYEEQVNVGMRPGGGRHVVDAIVEKDGRKWLISVKWQQTSGTAEQKVPFEVICLNEALAAHDFDGAYLVLGGAGWKLRDYYTQGGLKEHLKGHERVLIVTLEDFVAKTNRGEL